MFETMDFNRKRILMWVIAVLALFISYQLSFKRALEAISLHKELKSLSVSNASGNQGFNDQFDRKSIFYKGILKGYKIKDENRETRLWQHISAMAVSAKVKISFSAEKEPVQTDSVAVKSGIVTDHFTFTGRYFDLVKLLDTISKSDGIGKISALSLQSDTKDKQDEKEMGLRLRLQLKGIKY